MYHRTVYIVNIDHWNPMVVGWREVYFYLLFKSPSLSTLAFGKFRFSLRVCQSIEWFRKIAIIFSYTTEQFIVIIIKIFLMKSLTLFSWDQWVQRSGYKTANFITAKLQNGERYKTANQIMANFKTAKLQNSERYKNVVCKNVVCKMLYVKCCK